MCDVIVMCFGHFVKNVGHPSFHLTSSDIAIPVRSALSTILFDPLKLPPHPRSNSLIKTKFTVKFKSFHKILDKTALISFNQPKNTWN